MGPCSWNSPCYQSSWSSWLDRTVFWRLGYCDSKVRWQCRERPGSVLEEAVYAINQHSTYVAISPIARTYGSRDQGGKIGVVQLTIIPGVR